jgi:hypothetical protein
MDGYGFMDGHHLILGKLVDYITGQTLDDTHDERYCQKIAHLLVDHKGYAKKEISPRRMLSVRAGTKSARVPITYTVELDGFIGMLIQYGPGSLVTRHRPALAMSRLVAAYQVPVVVVTNGEQADILEGASAKVRAHGLDSIPERAGLQQAIQLARSRGISISGQKAEKEARIVMAYEVDDRCPCDTSVCKTENET